MANSRDESYHFIGAQFYELLRHCGVDEQEIAKKQCAKPAGPGQLYVDFSRDLRVDDILYANDPLTEQALRTKVGADRYDMIDNAILQFGQVAHGLIAMLAREKEGVEWVKPQNQFNFLDTKADIPTYLVVLEGFKVGGATGQNGELSSVDVPGEIKCQYQLVNGIFRLSTWQISKNLAEQLAIPQILGEQEQKQRQILQQLILGLESEKKLWDKKLAEYKERQPKPVNDINIVSMLIDSLSIQISSLQKLQSMNIPCYEKGYHNVIKKCSDHYNTIRNTDNVKNFIKHEPNVLGMVLKNVGMFIACVGIFYPLALALNYKYGDGQIGFGKIADRTKIFSISDRMRDQWNSAHMALPPQTPKLGEQQHVNANGESKQYGEGDPLLAADEADEKRDDSAEHADNDSTSSASRSP